jgi:hypothetical protein
MMTGEITERSPAEVPRSLDSGVPFLAMRAAVQLDNLILKKTKSVDAVETLGARLVEIANATASVASKKAIIDPVAIRILRMVNQHARKEAPIGSEELVLQAKENGTKLIAAAARQSTDDELTTLRTYCLALSRTLASFYQSRQDNLKPLRRI